MKTLLYIYLGISVITFILHTFTSWKVAYEFKNKYPNIKIPKTHPMNKIFQLFKLVLICFMPIVNLIFFLTILFCGEKLEKRTIERVYSELAKEEVE